MSEFLTVADITLILRNTIDIALASIMVYLFLKMIVKSEKMVFILNAIIMLIIFYILAKFFQLQIVSSILQNIFSWGIVLIFILFQNEIRTILERFGKINKEKDNIKYDSDIFIIDFVDCIYSLAQDNIGALISFEKDYSMEKYAQKGVKLDALYSSYLLKSIFQKDSPLHDGAVILKDNKIMYSSAYYPIELDVNIDKSYGTRHRAAVSISRETDSITIVVSEETGSVSIAFKDNLYENLEKDFVVEYLTNKLKPKE